MTTVVEKPRNYRYEPGTVRWCLLLPNQKPHRSGGGWKVEVIETNYHPITFDEFVQTQTWIKETYIGG